MHREDFPLPLRDEAAHVFGCSDFVAESFARDSELWTDLQAGDPVGRVMRGLSSRRPRVSGSPGCVAGAAAKWYASPGAI